MKSTGLVLAEKPSIGIEPTRLYDRSRFGNHGTHTAITMVQLPSGLWVRDFNSATPSYIEITPTPTQMDFTTGAFSVLAWVNIDDLTDRRFILVRGLDGQDGWNFFIYTNGRLQINTHAADGDDVSYSSASDVTTGSWFMVGFSRSGTSVIPYKNGVDIHQTSGVHNTIVTSSRTAKIGIHDGKSLYPFDGKMGLPKVFNYALSAGQIKKIFENQRHWFGV